MTSQTPAGTLYELRQEPGKNGDGDTYTAAILAIDESRSKNGRVVYRPVPHCISETQYRELRVKFAPYREATDRFLGREFRTYNTQAQAEAGVKVDL